MLLSILALLFLISGGDAERLPAVNSPNQAPIIAVASNFTGPARELAAEFEALTGNSVVMVSGSTGKHFAQISNGAPFAAFLAADAERPRLLDEQGMTVPGTRFTYAIGRIALWSPRADFVDSLGAVLRGSGFTHLAVANSRLAPYGQAAQEVLAGLGLWVELQPKLVRGENISQTFQFVMSGNAELGFIALSQFNALSQSRDARGSVWIVPADQHQPILQQAVLLVDDPIARSFLEFLQSAAARKIIRSYGYDLPFEAAAILPETR